MSIVCVVVGIVGAVWCISSCVTRGATLGVTLGGLPWFSFCVACTLGAGFCCWIFLVGYQSFVGTPACFGLDGNYFVPLRCPLCMLGFFSCLLV